MATTKYSHAFFIGSFPKKVKTSTLDAKNWQHKPLSIDEYRRDCGTYYKSHVDAMSELIDNDVIKQSRPSFLKNVKHFCHNIENVEDQIVPMSGTKYNLKTGETEVVHLDKYNLKICNLHLYFFPFDITFFVIEIDDSGSEINDLTMAHFWLMGLSPYLLNHSKAKLNNVLSPIMSAIGVDDYSKLINNGNKLKLFQTIQVNHDEIKDESALLYELGSSSAIGSVHANKHMSPSEDYVNNILKNNVVSAFKEWKALALVDSFTALSFEERFDPWAFLNQYFPYIYLRCLFEKTFCFSRNNMFRLNNGKRNLSQEVMKMEKYYFYDEISFNFLPNMMYQSMSKGLGIKKEKMLLSKQIKEKSDTNISLFLSMLSALAVFSVCSTISTFLQSIMNAYLPCWDFDGIIPVVMFGIAVIISVYVAYFLYSHKRI